MLIIFCFDLTFKIDISVLFYKMSNSICQKNLNFTPLSLFRPFNEKSSPGNISKWNSRNFLVLFVNWWTTFVCQMHPHFKLQVGNINRNFVIYMSIAANKRNQEIRIWGTSTFVWKNNQFSRHLNVSKLFIIIYPTCLNQLYANSNTRLRWIL